MASTMASARSVPSVAPESCRRRGSIQRKKNITVNAVNGRREAGGLLASIIVCGTCDASVGAGGKYSWEADGGCGAACSFGDESGIGGGIVLEPGRVYKGRLRVAPGQCLRVTSRDPGAGQLPAVLEHVTREPYESTIVLSSGAQLYLENVDVRHASPSVANNFAITVGPGASLSVVNGKVTSDSGSGLGLEGGEALLEDAIITGKVHGIAAFADDIDTGRPAAVTVRRCKLGGGGFSVLARGDEVSVRLESTTLTRPTSAVQGAVITVG